MKIWRPDLIIVFGSLTIGSLIYLITRTEATFLNHYFSWAIGGHVLITFQELISNDDLPSWIIYSLPDALWMLAMAVAILTIWKFQINLTSIFFTLLATMAGMSHEIFQGIGIIQGTFDPIDLAFIGLAGLLPTIWLLIKTHFIKSSNYPSIHTTS